MTMVGAIEDAVIARIQAAAGAGNILGYAVPLVESYGGQLSEDGLAVLVKRVPAVLIAFAGEQKPVIDARGEVTQANFIALCATRSVRNEKSGRRGAVGVIGAYQIFNDVRALLRGQTLTLDIEPISVGRIEVVHTVKTKAMSLTVYGVHFSTKYALDEAVAAETLNDFVTFHSDWDLPPQTTPDAALPLPSADLSDTLTLETSP